MGNQESTINNPPRSSSTEVYLPMGGMRMNGEKETDNDNTSQILPRKPRSQLLKTSYTGIWSMVNTDNSPAGRTLQFWCTDEENRFVYTGFGIGQNDEYLTDINKFNISTREWTPFPLKGDTISPRVNSRAIISKGVLYIFGGNHDRDYYNDIYSITLSTGEVKLLQTTGGIPSPRSSPVIGLYNQHIYIWGGYDGLNCPSELHILNLDTLEWTVLPQAVIGRASPSYVQVNETIYAYGSSKVGGLIMINLETNTVSQEPTTGCEPIPTLVDASLVYFDNFLLLIGGRSHTDYTYVYALSLDDANDKKWWFVFHVIPDGETVSVSDGDISDVGMFMVPRIHSLGVVFDQARRQILGFFGSIYKQSDSLVQLDIGDALSFIHLRDDMMISLRDSISSS